MDHAELMPGLPVDTTARAEPPIARPMQTERPARTGPAVTMDTLLPDGQPEQSVTPVARLGQPRPLMGRRQAVGIPAPAVIPAVAVDIPALLTAAAATLATENRHSGGISREARSWPPFSFAMNLSRQFFVAVQQLSCYYRPHL